MKFRDYYSILGVDRSASDADIKRAYRKLARELHPDVNKGPDADRRFKEVNEANEVLSDPQKRKRYDALGPDWQSGQDVDAADTGGPGGFHVNMGRGGGRRRSGGRSTGGGRGAKPQEDPSDFFDAFFGPHAGAGSGSPFGEDPNQWASRMRASAAQAQARDSRAELELPLVDAALGCTRRLTVRDGEGGTRTIDVRIPRGTTDGAVIRLAGQARESAGGGPPGDLLLTVKVAPDPRFAVNGLDLSTVVNISPWEAALGVKAQAPTLEGPVMVTVPAGSSSGQRLRLRGKGLPGRGENPPGDLIAELRIVLPKTLSEPERTLFEQLRDTSLFQPRP